jgi:hypothetical protein
MHTIMVIAGGLVLLGLFLLVGRLAGGQVARTALWFLPVWLVAAAVNMWIGVTHAGYSVAAEAPIFLVVFAVPAATALLARRMLARR